MKLTGDDQAAVCSSPAVHQACNKHEHSQFRGDVPLDWGSPLDGPEKQSSERTVTSPKTHFPQAGGDSRALSPLQTPLPFPNPSALPGKGTGPGSSRRNDHPLPCTHSASLPAVINLAVGETGEMKSLGEDVRTSVRRLASSLCLTRRSQGKG